MVSSKFLKFFLTLFGVTICHAILAHAFYVSVYSVNFDADRQELNVVCKVFTNDLDEAVKKENSILDFQVDARNSESFRKMTSDYILEKTKIMLDDRPATLTFDNLSWDGSGITETTLCHFKIKDISSVKTIEVHTKLLLELYDDQVNIIQVRVGDKRKALNLDKRVYRGKLEF